MSVEYERGEHFRVRRNRKYTMRDSDKQLVEQNRAHSTKSVDRMQFVRIVCDICGMNYCGESTTRMCQHQKYCVEIDRQKEWMNWNFSIVCFSLFVKLRQILCRSIDKSMYKVHTYIQVNRVHFFNMFYRCCCLTKYKRKTTQCKPCLRWLLAFNAFLERAYTLSMFLNLRS